MSDRYNFSLTTFSPSGKLGQIEHALNTVSQGSTCIGVKTTRGVVLLSDSRVSSVLIDSRKNEKVSIICENIGMTYSGLGPDARLILLKARKLAQAYRRNLGENPPVSMLVRDIAHVFQEFTQSGGVRPFGVSLLVAGCDKDQGPCLYQVDPSGTYWAWKATSIGKNYIDAKSFIEKRYNDSLDIEDAVQIALQTLRQTFEGKITPENIQIGIADTQNNTFKVLSADDKNEFLQVFN